MNYSVAGLKIAIIDWDVHHGNGTEQIFASDPNILYCSNHQHPLYPGSGTELTLPGQGKGRRNVVNVPIVSGTSASEFLRKFDIVLSEVQRFEPEFIFISCGFDAHMDDPLGGLCLEDNDYYKMTKSVVGLADLFCQGRIISVLEGGYDLEALQSSAEAHMKGLLDC